MSKTDLQAVKTYLRQLQDDICEQLEQEDGKNSFYEDSWDHANGGGGITRALEEGGVIEKSGVKFSHVRGDKLPTAASVKSRTNNNATTETQF